MLTDFRRLMRPADGSDIVLTANSLRAPTIAGSGSEVDVVSAFRRAQVNLVHELIQHIHSQTPVFFEDLVLDVLLAAGYGARRRDLARRLGRTGDGGIDGLIAQDELGLDLIYVQAKRLKPGSVVPVSEVRDFVGSLAGKSSFESVTARLWSGATGKVTDEAHVRASLVRRATDASVSAPTTSARLYGRRA